MNLWTVTIFNLLYVWRGKLYRKLPGKLLQLSLYINLDKIFLHRTLNLLQNNSFIIWFMHAFYWLSPALYKWDFVLMHENCKLCMSACSIFSLFFFCTINLQSECLSPTHNEIFFFIQTDVSFCTSGNHEEKAFYHSC